MKKYSSGFALLESILIFVIIAILGGTIYFVYKSNQNTSESLQNVGSSEIATPKKQTSSTPASTQNYVTIKEWGVRAPYSGSMNFTYTITDNAAQFSTRELAAIDLECMDFGGGTIARYAPNDLIAQNEGGNNNNDIAAKQYVQKYNDVAHGYAGGYYYLFGHDQAACSDKEQAMGLQTKANDTLKALVSKLEAIPAQ